MSRFVRMMAVALLISTSSMTSWAQNFIKGTVRFENGEPAKYVIVRLRCERIVFTDDQKTDDMGKFSFDGLVPNLYHLSIEGQGFRPYTSELDISMSKMAIEQMDIQQGQHCDLNLALGALRKDWLKRSIRAEAERILHAIVIVQRNAEWIDLIGCGPFAGDNRSIGQVEGFHLSPMHGQLFVDDRIAFGA